jgi:hypothetical protein
MYSKGGGELEEGLVLVDMAVWTFGLTSMLWKVAGWFDSGLGKALES